MSLKSLGRAVFFLAASALPGLAMHPAAPVRPSRERPLTPVIIDPGHGGIDWGAVVKGVKEKDLALIFARKLKTRLLRNADLPVVLTREGDTYVRLDDRMIDSVDRNGSIFVSLHLDKITGKKATGTVVYSFGPDRKNSSRRLSHPSVPPMPAPPKGQASESERLAQAFTQTLRAAGFEAETAKSDYYVLKNPAQPSVLIELGFLNNPEEAAKLSDPSYQDKMVESLAKTIENYATKQALRSTAAAEEPRGFNL